MSSTWLGEALGAGGILAQREDQTPYPSAGEAWLRIHGTHAGGVVRGVEQRGIAPSIAMAFI